MQFDVQLKLKFHIMLMFFVAVPRTRASALDL